jgi:arsenate reductase
MIQIYHNPRCSKSRDCLAFMDGNQQTYEVINYLDTPPTADELKAIIKKLGIKPIELVRTKELLWNEKFKGRKLTNAQLIKAMVKYPILIERPIVVNGDKAVIARPVENAKSII